MFTDCPSCSRQFHIYAKQLSVAEGQVKCGYCGQQFNALLRLHDKPLSYDEKPLPVATEQEAYTPDHGSEPQFEIPDTKIQQDVAEAEAEDAGIEEIQVTKSEGTPDETSEEINHISEAYQHILSKSEVSEQSEDGAVYELEDAEVNKTQVESPEGTVNHGATDATTEGMEKLFVEHKDDELPDILVEESLPRASLFSRLLWSFGILVLLIIVVTQFAWFQRDELISRYPELIPWLDRVCRELDCEVIRFRDVSAIKLVNRDVREHPRYEKALLVNATMINQSHTTQAFPNIQLSLFDTNGDLIAHRVFTPQDYLDESISIMHGMTPDMQAHFVLEVTGATEGAVSFEFNFL